MKEKEEDMNENLISTNFQPLEVIDENENENENSASKFLYSKKSTDIDFNRAKNKSEIINNGEEADKLVEKGLSTDVKSVNLFKIYCHLTSGMDCFLIFFAIIGSIGAGLTFPLMIYTTSDVYSQVGNTSEMKEITEEDIKHMLEIVAKVLDDQVKRQLYNGAFSFTCYFISIFFWSLVGNKCIYKLKEKYFTIILKQEQSWFDSNNPLEISTNVNAQLEDIEQGIGERAGALLTILSQCIAGFVFAFLSSWKLTLVMCSVMPVAIILANIFMASMTKGAILSKKIWGEAGGIIEEILYNIKTVASFANFEFEIKKFYEKVEEVWKIDLSNAYKLGGAMGSVTFLLNGCIFIAFMYGRLLITGNVKMGNVISAMFCALMGIGGIISITPNVKMIKEACISFSGYYNLYRRKPQIDLSNSIEKPPLSQIKGKIEFKDVSFYYPSDNSKKKILDKINLVFEPGKKIAIVGESGCGKSTIVNLIERLYDITEGQILIDGLEIKRYNLEYLRNIIGYVQQEPVLFNKSIKENIIFGREEYLKTFGNIDQLINNVSHEVYISEFIDSVPEKYDYNVGIKGSKLSGGQKQRVAIARAILANPKILILDEATSALDNISEKEVQRALDNISHKNVTTIIIAHRLSTVKNADLIYVIKKGKVEEKGTHNELLELGGVYANLVRSQLNDDTIKKEELEEVGEIQKSRNTIQDIKFNNDNSKIALSIKDIPFKPCILIKELKDFKCMLFFAILSASILGLLSPINGFIMAKGMNALNSSDPNQVKEKGFIFAFISLGISAIQGIGTCLMLWKFTSLGVTLGRIFRKKIFAKYLQLHLSFFDLKENAPGALVTKLAIDTMNLNQLILTITGTLIQCICITILGMTLGCLIEYRLTLIDFAFVPFIVLANIFRRINQGGGQNKKGFEGNIEAGAILSECVINTPTIFAFNFQKSAIKMYLEVIEYVKKHFLTDSLINGFFIGLGNFCSFATYSAVFYATKKFLLAGEIDSENMVIVIGLINTCTQGITNSMGTLGNIKKAIVSYKSIYSTLNTASLISAFKNDNEGKQSAKNIKGKIEFKNVYFTYPTRPESIILKNFSLTINPGQHIALVGPSGCGKSTIIQLLSRFYDVEDGKGEILIDGKNIKEYNLYELRKKVGLVSQEPCLFKVSVLENVRYGNLQATNKDCIEAAKKANIMKFFSNEKMNGIIDDEYIPQRSATRKTRTSIFYGPHHKKGRTSRISYSPILDIPEFSKEEDYSNIGEKKDPISGGEKQRLAIARAFLKNPTILLLDEATSALDKNSEIEVQKSLEKLAQNRTCISIAHRLSTIEKCDQIYVLEKGKIVEQGTHKELMELGKQYHTLYTYSNAS